MQRFNHSRKVALTVIVLLACMASAAFAEEKKPEDTTPPATYRVEITMKEMDGPKQVNSRRYEMNIKETILGKIRVGSRVPYATSVGGDKGASYQYADIGMNIDCRTVKLADGVNLSIMVDSTSLANEAEASWKMLPVTRQQRLEAGGVVQLGKPTLMGSMDDVSSNHRYDVEVTVTGVK